MASLDCKFIVAYKEGIVKSFLEFWGWILDFCANCIKEGRVWGDYQGSKLRCFVKCEQKVGVIWGDEGGQKEGKNKIKMKKFENLIKK